MTFPTQLLGFINEATDQVAYNRITLGAATTEFTVPDGVFQISGVVIGGGGGGNGSDGTGSNNSNGGSGAGLCWGTFSVLPGDVLKLDVATGGTRGNALDATSGSGFEGGNTGIFLVERGGTDYRSSPIEILFAEGGDGGVRTLSGTPPGGVGGQGLATQTLSPEILIFDSGAYQGGSGGFVNSGTSWGAGGGGSAGYAGNGGTGGNNSTQPTDAATGSGGGGGGGSQSGGLGFGGGGSGSFGFDAGTQGSAGINNTSGGTGGSFFEDPGLGIRAEKVGETIAVTGPGITTIAIPPGTDDNDFLLLLSASDKDSGLTVMPVPVGFTTFNQSSNGEYYVSFDDFNIAQNGGTGFTTEAIANNTPAQYQNRDLNFANSYQFVDDITSFTIDPPGSGQRCVTGLTNFPAIHNLISLRFIPNPAQIDWVASSGDPSINSPSATSMPDPPSISGISSGSIAIALGYLANTTINPSPNIAPTGYTAVPEVADNPNAAPQTTACLAAFKQITSTGTENPGAFLTGTASHSRAYTLEMDWNGVGSGIQFVGYGVVDEDFYVNNGNSNNFSLNSQLRDVSGNLLPNNTPNTNDLIVVATSADNPTLNSVPIPDYDGNAMITIERGTQNDFRQGTTSGLGYGLWYDFCTNAGGGIVNDLVTGTAINYGIAPSASLILVFRNVDTVTPFEGSPIFSVLDTDNLPNKTVGAPDPPARSMTSGNMSLIVGMIDDQKISLVDVITAPTDQVDGIDYTMLSQASYGVQNNGVIVMSAIREDCQDTTNPSSFVANGANIWSSQTIIIGGPGSQTGGTSTSAGQYGGGGGGRSQNSTGQGMAGADGAVRLIWGSSRLYPFRDGNTGNFTVVDFVP